VNQRSIIFFILLSVAVFTGLAIYGDASELLASILVLSPAYWLAALGLTFAHILVRLFRWHYYLKILDISAEHKTSALVFLSGLSMIMIPGRVGELAKSLFLKQKLDIPIRLTAPVIVVERLMDVTSVLFLGMWGMVFIPYGWAIIMVTMAGLAVFVGLLSSSRGVGILVRLPVIRKWEPIISDSGQAFQKLLSLKVLLVGLFIGTVAWFMIGFAFWVVLQGLESDVTIPMAVSIFSASTLLGSITMLPGGLISTEGSMLALLYKAGLGGTLASAAILIIRVITLWFAVLVGFVALLYLQKYQPKKLSKVSVEVNGLDRHSATVLLKGAEPVTPTGTDS
jgi:uncharacterized protein (TIRG00374 family)